jgi:hypothetical protein
VHWPICLYTSESDYFQHIIPNRQANHIETSTARLLLTMEFPFGNYVGQNSQQPKTNSLPVNDRPMERQEGQWTVVRNINNTSNDHIANMPNVPTAYLLNRGRKRARPSDWWRVRTHDHYQIVTVRITLKKRSFSGPTHNWYMYCPWSSVNIQPHTHLPSQHMCGCQLSVVGNSRQHIREWQPNRSRNRNINLTHNWR